VAKKIVELQKKKKSLWSDLGDESSQEAVEPTDEELGTVDVVELKKDIALLEEELKNMKPNMVI